MSKETIIVLALVIVAFFGGYYFSKNDGIGTSNPKTEDISQAPQQILPEVTMEQINALFNDNNLVFGNKDSKLKFVIVSDPSCPYCHVASGKNSDLNKKMGDQFILKSDGGSYVAPEPEMKKLVDSGKAALVWIYANGHGNGELATEALYCANEVGKFWEVHDRLMSPEGYDMINTTVKNDRTKIANLVAFLKNSTDSNKLKSCLDSGKYTKRISEDMVTSVSIKFEGTPYFLVNTTRFVGAYSYADMEAAVNTVLK
jgi:protein-disulfide isomerase